MRTTVLLGFIEGTPAPQGSKRHVGKGRMIETSKKLKPWRDTLTRELRQRWAGRPPLDIPVHVSAYFYLPRPQRPRFNNPAVPPDTDKLQRAVGDALQHAGILKDDARIIRWTASKQYPDSDQATGVYLHLTYEQEIAPGELSQ